ncbi:MAG: glutamine--fructose-6-phosphate transaminase (isomerizing) [Nitrospirae bacterium]|nr:glutamine--fructose-6-phosphate transaminase (isomerizing) [Nitrospirota bacterium]
MCGIVGYIGKRNAIPVLLDGLRKLEYRGYDSAGIAFFRNGRIEVRRCAGKIRDLEGSIAGNDLRGFAGIGHTRWATHGRPTEENAHPHRAGGVVIVHNGIIENYLELKNKLRAEGHIFASDTDTEVLCHLISSYTDKGLDLETATREALKDVKGAYALGIIREEEPDKIIAVKKDCPLVVGLGESEFFISSDIPAFLSYTRNMMILDNNELAVITPDGVFISKISGESVEKKVTNITWSPAMAEKGGYRHFMLKEIYEQPRAVADTVRGRFSIEDAEVNLDEFSMRTEDLQKLDRVFFVACGTSWHAALIGRYMLEGIARMPSEVDIASEFRYREPILSDRSLVVVITQSGETADTIAAQREAKRLGAKVLSICNVVGSTSAREADYCFYTHSGPEIGVASTKAFVSQLVGLYLFAIAVAKAKGMFTKEMAKALLTELLELPEKAEKALALDDSVAKIAREFFKVKDFLYLGRGINYPVALEGALKLKEISYIHAEGYPAGEMKHGPIALIDDSLPVLVLAPRDKVYEKVLSNIEEVRSRGGKIIAFATEGDTTVSSLASRTIFVPVVNQYLIPVLFAIPLQLLAYHIAVLRECDVDQPRNLAKSVTVE